MLSVTTSVSTWPNEVLKFEYPEFISGLDYQICPQFARTISTNLDGVHEWVNVNLPGPLTPTVVHNGIRNNELNVPISASTPISYNLGNSLLSSSMFIPCNDQACLTLRAFEPYNPATGATISPIFSALIDGTVAASAKEIILETTTMDGGSGCFVMPTHLIFTDSRAPSSIRIAKNLQLYPALREWQYYYYGTYKGFLGTVNATPYTLPFVKYSDFTFMPLVSTNITPSQASALKTVVHIPIVAQHVAGLSGLSPTVDGASSYTGNLLTSLSSTRDIIPGSVLFKVGYYDPAVVSDRHTTTQIFTPIYKGDTFLPTIPSDTVYNVVRDQYRLGFIRDVALPRLSAINPDTGSLIGRAGNTSEIIVNSAISFVNYQTGQFEIHFNNGYTFNGTGIAPLYYNRSFVEFGGYPDYKQYDINPIDQKSNIYNPVRTIGNDLNVSFDVNVVDLSSVVDLDDYPTFGSRLTTITASAIGAGPITFDSVSTFSSVSAISFSSINNVPQWLYTYNTSISSPSIPFVVNGMNLNFNTLSAHTRVNSNSAIITPLIVSNYGTTTCEFSTNDAYYGYFQLECPGAIQERNYNNVSHTLSVYMLDTNNVPITAYPITTNALELSMPYGLNAYEDVRSIPLSTILETFDATSTLPTLQNVAYYYADTIESMLSANTVPLQLYAVDNAIKTLHPDNTLSFMSSTQVFINKMYKYINECINPSNRVVSDISQIHEELNYKFNTCGTIYKSFYEIFNNTCRAYINNATVDGFIIPAGNIEVCNEIGVKLQALATAETNGAIGFNIASTLFSIKEIIDGRDTVVSYNFIIDVLTESFILATWPGSFNVASVFNQDAITYNPGAYSIIKKVISLRLERVFNYYNFALSSARNAGVITPTKYTEIIGHFASNDYPLFYNEISKVKTLIDYSTLLAAQLNKQYVANSNKNTGYYIFRAEAELEGIFKYIYLTSAFDRNVYFGELYRSLRLDEYGVQKVLVGYVNKHTLIDRQTGLELAASDGLSAINTQFNNTNYTSALVPLSCRFCIISPTSGDAIAKYKLNMFSNVVGSRYTDIQHPEFGVQDYVLKNSKLNRRALSYSKPSFVLNAGHVRNELGVTFSKPLSTEDVVRAYINIPPALIPAREAVNSTVYWSVSVQSSDADYATVWASNTVGTNPFTAVGGHSQYTTALAATARGSVLEVNYTPNTFIYNYNTTTSIDNIGLNPITVSVSVVSNYLSGYGSPYITNNMLTGVGVFTPDLGLQDTVFTFDSLRTSAYSTNVITSNLSVVSTDYTALDNPILLRNYFIKDGKVYDPPVNEYITFNIESVYGATRLFKLDSPAGPEVEITQGSAVRNSPYFKIKTLMPKTLSTFAPTKDELRITAYSTPASIKSPDALSASLNFYPHSSNLYSKFDIVATSLDSATLTASDSSVNTDLLLALTATSDPYKISLTPVSSPYLTFSWSASSLPSSAYDVSTSIFTLSSYNLSAINNGVAVLTLSTVFNYLDGVTKAVMLSDPLYIYTSNQVISAFDAKAWTINNFDANGVAAVNTSAARIVNTNLTSMGDNHVETLALSTTGTPFARYVWQIEGSVPYVTSSQATSANIIGIAGTTHDISVTGFDLQFTSSTLLDSLSSNYATDRVIVINPSVLGQKVFENEKFTVSTLTSAITSSYLKRLEFLELNTPTVSSNFYGTVYYYSSAIDTSYDISIQVDNTHGEQVLSGTTTVFGVLKDLNSGLTRNIDPVVFPLASGLNTNAVVMPSIANLDLFNCSLLTLSSTDVVYTTVSGSNNILQTTNLTGIRSLSAIKLPEHNIFWDNAYYTVGDSLVIKNNNTFFECYGQNTGFDTLSVKFNDEIQIVPASSTQITFNNLNDTGIYAIEISGSTLSSLSASYPMITKSYNNAITVVNSFDTFNSKARVLNETLKLPYSLNEVLVAPNEFIVASNINNSLTKLYENYEYLKNKAEFNDTKLPVGFNKWLGSVKDSFDKWHYVEGNWADSFRSIIANEFKDIIGICIVKDVLIIADRLAAGNDRITVYNLDLLSNDIGIKSTVISEDKFAKIVAIDVDSEDNLYVLDEGNNSVYIFEVDTSSGLAVLTLTKKIGGLGNASRPYRFKQPTNIHVSNTDMVYIVDKGNDVVKTYNNKLNHLRNITHSDWVLQNDLVSVSTDTDGNVYVLRGNGNVYVFDINNINTLVITDIPNTFGGAPRQIHCNNIDSGLFYIVYNTHVSKITSNGVYIGYFRPLHHPYVNDLRCIEQFNRNIIIGDKFSLYNTIDFISLKNILNDIDSLEWKLEDILIDSSDLVQDWVYNVVFNRLRDNLELYVKNLHSKYIFNVTIDSKVIADIIPMPTSELPVLDFEQCFIGQNELVFADVINRVLKQLYMNQELVLTAIESTVSTNVCADNWCWSWGSLGSFDPVKKNCLINPISFMELRSNSPGIGGRTWAQLTNVTTCCEIISS